MGFSLDFIAADADLTPWALGVSILRADGINPAGISIPAHSLAISTVVLRGELWQMDRQGRRSLMPLVYTTGSATQAQGFEGSKDVVCASLMCVASVLPLLTGASAHGFVNTFAPPDVLGALTPAELDPTQSNQALGHCLMAMLRSRLATVAPGEPFLAFLATLQRWDGRCTVPSGWHTRRWQRACHFQLGVTPKLLQRLVRLHQSARVALVNPVSQASVPTKAWVEHALDAGYSDQSHMLRDYRALAGLSPARASAVGDGENLQALAIGANSLAPRLLPGLVAVSDFSNT